jgi:hypothetical protein
MGNVYKAGSSEVAGRWEGDVLYAGMSQTALLTRRGDLVMKGNAASPVWRVVKGEIYRAGSSQPSYRIRSNRVFKDMGYDMAFQVSAGSLYSGNGRTCLLKGENVSDEELVLAGLALALM